MPFQAEVTSVLSYDGLNRLSVAVNNTLTPDSVPQGNIKYFNHDSNYPRDFYEVQLNFDFFNYAGIHRSVRLYSVPKIHIYDLSIVTGLGEDNETGLIDYSYVYHDTIQTNEVSTSNSLTCQFELYEKNSDRILTQSTGCSGKLTIPEAKLWWPIHMDRAVDHGPGYLYTGKFILLTGDSVVDVYYQKIGIRTVRVTENEFLINNKPVYFVGFGKHEDSNVS